MRVIDVKDLPGLAGEDLGASDWVTIDQTLIDRFADLCHDHQWIHVDVERANAEIGGTIAHGFLTLSLMSAMMHNLVDVRGYKRSINYGFDKLRFTAPVPAGSRVRLRAKLAEVTPREDGYMLRRDCTVEIEGQARPAIYAEWLTYLVV
jgi:acyl dehydratase